MSVKYSKLGNVGFSYNTVTGDITVQRNGTDILIIKGDGTLQISNGSTFAGVSSGKVVINSVGGDAFTGTATQIYKSGTKLVFASKDSSSDSQWFFIDFDDLGAGLQTSSTEPV